MFNMHFNLICISQMTLNPYMMKGSMERRHARTLLFTSVCTEPLCVELKGDIQL